MDLDTGENDRSLAAGEQRGSFVGRFGSGVRVAARFGAMERMRDVRDDMHHVARDFDEDGSLETLARVENPVDFAERIDGVGQIGPGDTKFLENFHLCMKVPDLVVEQRIIDPLVQSGRTGDQHDRRFLGVSSGNGVADAESPHAIRDTDRSHPVNAGIGVGRETGTVLARAADHVDRALLEHAVEGQHVVAGNAKDRPNSVVLQPANEVLADREPFSGYFVVSHGRPCFKHTTLGRFRPRRSRPNATYFERNGA